MHAKIKKAKHSKLLQYLFFPSTKLSKEEAPMDIHKKVPI